MSESSNAPEFDPRLQGAWKVLWRRVNGQPPRRGASLYLFGDYLLVHTHTNPIPYDYSADTTSSPCRLDLRNQIMEKTQNAIYMIDGDNLQICETCQFFGAKERGIEYPQEFRTETGDQYTLTALQRVPLQLGDLDVEKLPQLVAEHCGPAPMPRNKEDIKRRAAIRKSRSESAEKRIGELACSVGEKYKGNDFVVSFLLDMAEDEKVPFAVFWLLAEVNNGGFYQYLHNETGAIAVESLQLLKAIGAHSAADMLDEALRLFPNSEPAKQTDVRRSQLESFTLEQHEVLQSLNDRFYQRTEDTCAIAKAYLDSDATGQITKG